MGHQNHVQTFPALVMCQSELKKETMDIEKGSMKQPYWKSEGLESKSKWADVKEIDLRCHISSVLVISGSHVKPWNQGIHGAVEGDLIVRAVALNGRTSSYDSDSAVVELGRVNV